MNSKTKTIFLTIILLTCLTFPILGSAESITVTSTGPAHIKFASLAQGSCYVQKGTLPTEMPSDFYFGQGNISLTGNADGKTNYDGLFANQTVTANGSLHIAFSAEKYDINFNASNQTIAYFLSDNYPSEYRDNFAVGCNFNKETTPKETRMIFTGEKTDNFGTRALSGSIVFYVDEENIFENDQAIGAILYDEYDEVIASIIWAKQETTAPWGFALNAANVFEHNVDFFTVAPSAKIVTNAAGQCIYAKFSVENDEMTDLQYGNGSLVFNAMALSEANIRQISENYVSYRDGVYGIGSISLNLQNNESINVNIYTNGSGTGGIILNEGNESIFIIGIVYESNIALQFKGTLQNTTGTYPIKGTFEVYSALIQQEDSEELANIVETILLDENEYPIIISIWSQGNYTFYSDEEPIELGAADSFERYVGFCPSACTSTVSASQTVIADHTAATGAKIVINGAMLPTGTAFNITTVNYSSTQPISVTTPLTQQATYFEARIIQTNGSALPQVTAQVSLTDSSFNVSSQISYWNGNVWVKAANQQFTAPNTISGEISASALADTAVMVDYSAPAQSTTPTTLPSSTATPPQSVIPEYNMFAILGLMTLLTVAIAITRLRTGKGTGNFKAATNI
jgi:hypothetical protein